MFDHENENLSTDGNGRTHALSKRELRILHLIDNAKLGMVVIDQSHQVIEANQRFADMLGYTLEEVKSLHTWDWEAVSSKDDIKTNFIDLAHVDFNIETRHRKKDGSLFDVEVSGTGYNFGGTPDNNVILCFCNDISDRIKAQHALLESERRFKSYVENAADILFTINPQHQIQYISPNCKRILGYAPEELTGDSFYNKIHDDTHFFLTDIQLFIDERPRPVCEYRIQHFDGNLNWYSFKFSKIEGDASNEYLLLCVARNINYQKEHEAQLEHLSMHDQLTGIYNRAYFFEALNRIDQLNSYPLSVLTYDLDCFKLINDQFGHAAGDEALVRTTKNIAKVLRKNDVFARTGGDEFSILLPSTPNAEAQMIAQRIRETLECDNNQTQEPAINISIGVATKNDQSTTTNAILQVADQRMYEEKRSKLKRL